MQQVTPGIGDAFGPVEQVLMKSFFLSLFQGLGEGTPGRGGHPPACETGGPGPPRPNKDGP